MNDPAQFSPITLKRGGTISPGHIRLEADVVTASFFLGKDPNTYREIATWITTESVTAFANLSNANPQEVLQFAQRWGVMGLFDDVDLLMQDHYREPVEDWLTFSRETAAILHISDLLLIGKKGLENDWAILRERWVPEGFHYENRDFHKELHASRTLFRSSPPAKTRWTWEQKFSRDSLLETVAEGELQQPDGFESPPGTADTDRYYLGLVINRWMQAARLRPTFEYSPRLRRWLLSTMHHQVGFFGEFCLALCGIIAGSESVAFCSYCQDAYTPRRRPTPGRANYCPNCRSSSVDDRINQRNRRAKLKGEK
jgi:hypothetical protein